MTTMRSNAIIVKRPSNTDKKKVKKIGPSLPCRVIEQREIVNWFT